MDLETLIAKHSEMVRTGSGARALANVEALLYAQAPVPRVGHATLRWLAKTLRQSQGALSRRRELWLCGEAAEPLWLRVEAGMPIGRASRVLAGARKYASRRDPVALLAAIEHELAKLDFRPPPAAQDTPPPRSAAEEFPDTTLGPREFWPRLRAVVTEHIRPRLELVPEHERERLLDEFDRDVQAVFAQHSSKWQKASLALREQRRVSRQQFADALRVLHMDPPRRNAPLAPIVPIANKQKRSLARLYHPDSHGGSEHTRAQYQAVIDAFLIVDQYVAENTKPVVPALRVVNGGK